MLAGLPLVPQDFPIQCVFILLAFSLEVTQTNTVHGRTHAKKSTTFLQCNNDEL